MPDGISCGGPRWSANLRPHTKGALVKSDESDSGVASNAAMREIWDGEVGRLWVEETDRYEQTNAGFGALDGVASLVRAEA